MRRWGFAKVFTKINEIGNFTAGENKIRGENDTK